MNNSQSLEKIENYKKKILKELLNQCTEEQKAFFNRMYVSVEKISENKIPQAIRQCERTIEMNLKN
jgi:hypothetical protein